MVGVARIELARDLLPRQVGPHFPTPRKKVGKIFAFVLTGSGYSSAPLPKHILQEVGSICQHLNFRNNRPTVILPAGEPVEVPFLRRETLPNLMDLDTVAGRIHLRFRNVQTVLVQVALDHALQAKVPAPRQF